MRWKLEAKLFLVILLAINVISGVLLAILAPMWSGPDEFPHYGYIRHLWQTGTLPDQRTFHVTQEIMASVHEADWFRVEKGKGKVGPGPEQFYANGFVPDMDSRGCASLSKSIAHGGEHSVEIRYAFTMLAGEGVGIHRDGLDISRSGSLGLWVHGDGSRATLAIALLTGGPGEHQVLIPVTWEGWRSIAIPFNDPRMNVRNRSCISAMLSLRVTDTSDPGASFSGSVFIDDIWLQGDGRKQLVTSFEPSELPFAADDAINWVGHHPPLYYLLGVPIDMLLADSPVFTRALALRLLSVVLSTITVLLVCFISQAIFGRFGLFWVLAPSLVVLSPVYALHQGYINNDHLLILLYTLMLYLMVKWVNEPANFKRVAVLGVIVGLGLITKLLFVTALVLVPVFLLFTERSGAGGKIRFKRVLVFSGAFFLAAFAVSGWWFFKNYLLYGYPVITLTSIWPADVWPTEMTYKEFFFSENFFNWVAFGWFVRRPTRAQFIMAALILDPGAIGLLWVLFRRTIRRAIPIADDVSRRLKILLCAVVIHFVIVWSQVSSGSINVGHFRALQGRYFFPVIAGIVALWAFGVSNIAPQRARRLVMAIIVAILISVQFSSNYLTAMGNWYPF
ncbi:hypothetical protein J7M28_04875 [bacterium]|nr:hypothetical protein [bacterium]